MQTDHLECYHRTAVFTEVNVPAKLLADHTTKAGTWGAIVIQEGRLELHREDGSQESLEAGQTGWVAPQEVHRVTCVEPVKFHIGFYRRKP